MNKKVRSPAKVNLTFKVLSKRSDGYHDIETHMQVVSLSDYLHFSLESDHISCTDPTIPCDERNLVHKARALFFEKTLIDKPVSIHIEKNIPHGAGLGGGSSNAATTLFVLNEIFDRPLSEAELLELAAQIGSDVPFFFSSGSALCTGRGEIMTDMPAPKIPSFIAKPKRLSLSTPAVYGKCKPLESLEPAAFRCLPQLQEFKQSLQPYFDDVFMSGSGTSFICYGAPKQAITIDCDLFPIEALSKKPGKWYA